MSVVLPCARCSHVNESRARFCANCGLNLAIAAKPVLTNPAPRSQGGRGRWLVLLLVSIGILVTGLASAFRISAPRRAVPPLRQFYEPMVDDFREGAEEPPRTYSPNTNSYRQHNHRVWHDQN